jgi:hypothetical protein
MIIHGYGFLSRKNYTLGGNKKTRFSSKRAFYSLLQNTWDLGAFRKCFLVNISISINLLNVIQLIQGFQ